MTTSPPSTGSFDFPLFKLLQGLDKLPGVPADGVTFANGQVVARDAATFRLDRLFDIFFESYWTRHAGLSQVALTGKLTGRARIEIWRRDALNGREGLLVSVEVEGRGEEVIAVPVLLRPPGEEGDASCLVATLHMGEGSVLRELHWCAAAPPVREVRIAGVICTFNREDMLAANLARFVKEARFLHRLIVINQGTPGIKNRIMRAHGSSTPILFVDQSNLGGAGGFTRGIVEGLDDPDVTHFLLMDDDIDAQPALLERIVAVLGYVGERHCIGGAMLNIDDPAKLFTCGDRMHPSRPAIVNVAPEPGDDDVTTDAGRDFVARQHRPDFNGWWCFAFPVAAVRQCGLPLPLFIRGDDVEFGLRLTRAGFFTLGWPGVAVWHMPFQLKAQPWQAFYDRRNMLFLNAAHRLYSRRREARSAWGSFCNALKVRDYARAEAVVEGIQAFNRGPAELQSWSSDDHAALLRRTADHSRRFRWASTVALWARAAVVVAALRWGRRIEPQAVLRFAEADFWRTYLPPSRTNQAPLHNKGFASPPDDGIAHSLNVKPMGMNSCDPI